MPAFIDTGLNVVDVRDTAEGHWLACERGAVGRALHPGLGESDAGADSAEAGARSPARKRPPSGLPYAVAYCAGACSTAWAGVTGKPPRVPLEAVRMAKKKMWVTHEKAARELGFSPGPAEQALRRAVEWFRGAGYRPAASPPRDETPDGGRGRDGVPRHPGARERSRAGAARGGLGALRAARRLRSAAGGQRSGRASAPRPRWMRRCRASDADAIVSTGFCGALDPELADRRCRRGHRDLGGRRARFRR